MNEAICEPFGHPRNAGRLLFDFSVMTCCMKQGMEKDRVLDFGAGSGWVTEFVARLGYRVTAFDIHGDLEGVLAGRSGADKRLDPSLMTFAHGDGHAMAFHDQSFGHILCFDTLHHMHSFDRVFAEFARILKPGGRAIFVEPVQATARRPRRSTSSSSSPTTPHGSSATSCSRRSTRSRGVPACPN